MITLVLFYTLLAATLSSFFFWSQKKGRWLYPYLPWLGATLLKLRKHKLSLPLHTPAGRYLAQSLAQEHCLLYKPLGGCTWCFHFWLSVVLALFAVPFLGVKSWVLMVGIGLPLSYGLFYLLTALTNEADER